MVKSTNLNKDHILKILTMERFLKQKWPTKLSQSSFDQSHMTFTLYTYLIFFNIPKLKKMNCKNGEMFMPNLHRLTLFLR